MDDQAKRFLEDLMMMAGEVPVETLVAKVRAQCGDDDAEIRALMGHVAFWSRSIGQSDDPLDHRTRDQLLDLIIALSQHEGEEPMIETIEFTE